MGTKGTLAKTNWTLGEISPRCQGRFDADKPIYKNGAAIMENWLSTQAGGAMYRPGNHYVATVKDQTNQVRFERFRYSISQEYVLEIGNVYMRFFADGGQVLSGGLPLEIGTPFLQSYIFQLQMANKADVMYIVHPSVASQKLTRTSATSFTIVNVPFVRGPFLDTNITTVTITPSSDTAATTLTASSAIFLSGHVGSLWRVKGGVVKITGFTSTTVVTGTVQAEPDGTAGNLGTGPGATTDWAEGAFSNVRGFPTAITFHQGRLIYGGTLYEPQKFWASVVGAFDNFKTGTGDDDAYTYEIASNLVNDIRWMMSSIDLKIGTGGGTITAKAQGVSGITPTSPPQIIIDTDYSVMPAEPDSIGGYGFYLQSNGFNLRQLVFDLIQNRDKSEDMTLLADHILRDGGGAVQIARQQSPCDRIWVIREDGQIAVFTRNPDQQVLAWSRIVAGYTQSGPGVFETIAILPQENSDDIVWVVCKRIINGVTKRYVEYFTAELFEHDYEPVRLDSSLSQDNPIDITGVTNASPCVVTAPSHGLMNGDQIKIDNILTYTVQTKTGSVMYGMDDLNTNVYLVVNKTANTFQLTDLDGNIINSTDFGIYISGGEVRQMLDTFSGLNHLEGEDVAVMTDGALPAAQQIFTVSGGSITLPNPAAVVHVGLPYVGVLKFLSLGSDIAPGVSYTKVRKLFQVNFKVWKSLGGQFGKDIDNLFNIIMPNQISNLEAYHSNPSYTGDIIGVDFESSEDTDWSPVLIQNEPLPFMLLAAVFRSEIFEDK